MGGIINPAVGTDKLEITSVSSRGKAEFKDHTDLNLAGDLYVPLPPQNINCLWHKERQKRSDIPDRERIREVLVNELNTTSSTFATVSKVEYQGSTYARRRLSRPYNFGVDFGNVLHGGTNYRNQKDRNFFKMATNVHGKKGSSGEPVNVYAIGLGKGNDIVGPKDCKDKESPTYKKYYDANITAGKFSVGQTTHTLGDWIGYEDRLSSGKYWPANIVSASVKSGYNKKVDFHFKSGSVVTNIHSDTVYFGNDIPMQGPFTDAHVGGNQHRHVEINRYNKDLRNPGTTGTPNQLQTEYTRPEAWRLLIGDNPSSVTPDGAMGYVGADYGGPYPDQTRKWAIYTREETAKRPINIKNIQTIPKGITEEKSKSGAKISVITGSDRLGNYRNMYEVLHTVGFLEQRINMRDFHDDQSLFMGIYKSLPKTTQPSSIFGAGTLLNTTARIPIVFDTGITVLQSDAKYDGMKIVFVQPMGFGLHKNHFMTINQATATTTKSQIGTNGATTYAQVVARITSAIDAAIADEAILATRERILTAPPLTVDVLKYKFPGETRIILSEEGSGFRLGSKNPGSGFRFGQLGSLPNEFIKGGKEHNTVIKSKFSAPGGIDTMSPSFLDLASEEYSVYNSINYRNLSVRGSGSGEEHTLRVNSNIGRRNGLRTLLARHCGKGGLDSEYDTLSYYDSGSKDPQAAFFKQHRNTLRVPRVEKIERRSAIHFPSTTEEDVGFRNQNFAFWPTNAPPLSFSFWFKGDAISGTTNRMLLACCSEVGFPLGAFSCQIGFTSGGSKELAFLLGVDQPERISMWKWDITSTYSDWTFYTIAWDGVGYKETTGPSLYRNTERYSGVSSFIEANGGFSNYNPEKSIVKELIIGDSKVAADPDGELQGSLANLAIWKTCLKREDVKDLYELNGDPLATESASALIDFWRLGTETELGNIKEGSKISAGKSIPSSIARNSLTTQVGMSGTLGPYDIVTKIKDKKIHDNMFVTSMIPRSDFQYSWIDGVLSSSTGDWLLDQKIRGYAPPSGKITIIGGSSLYKSVNAISFPTISDITCCDDGSLSIVIKVPVQRDNVGPQSIYNDDTWALEDSSGSGVSGLKKFFAETLGELKVQGVFEGGCCEEDTLKYKITWWNQGDDEPTGFWYSNPVLPNQGDDLDIIYRSEGDSVAYLKFEVLDCDSNKASITLTLNDAKVV